jgi:hypothetical protein
MNPAHYCHAPHVPRFWLDPSPLGTVNEGLYQVWGAIGLGLYLPILLSVSTSDQYIIRTYAHT